MKLSNCNIATDNERNPFDHGARMIKVVLES